MNRNEYLEYHASRCRSMIETTKRKNHDYAGAGGEDPFHNFRQVERMGICSVEVGFLTRMTDKISRIQSFVEQGVLQVKDESIEDTLIDLANYSVLLAGYIKSKKQEAEDEGN